MIYQDRFQKLSDLFYALMKAEGCGLGEDLSGITKKGGIYRIYEGEHTLYVGQSACLLTRIKNNLWKGNSKSHILLRKLEKYDKLDDKAKMKEQLRKWSVSTVIVEDPATRISAEHFVIAVLNPRYNDVFVEEI